MSDLMRQIPFDKLLDWTMQESQRQNSVFGVPANKFYHKGGTGNIKLFGEVLDTPVGPAAGPHTQLAQNIVAAYLGGARFFELKTVQILDKLEFPKPCIKAEDECYNTEWSTELAIEGAFDEYIKAWLLLHVVQKELLQQDERTFVFNMSVGYDLKGISSPKVDSFIEGLKDAAKTEVFQTYLEVLQSKCGQFKHVDANYIAGISSRVCNSITLSTLHGCPPQEIEAIAKYLMREKQLHTFVKMNPTLLGYEYVSSVFHKMGYTYIQLKPESFTHDLQYADGVAMLHRLRTFAAEHGRQFGVKLSNTLPVRITKSELPGDEMYMSGRALYPLTINLAYKLAGEFDGDLRISYSGGADAGNIRAIFATGIRPITLATTLLKPGGYGRMHQVAAELENLLDNAESGSINLAELAKLAEAALTDPKHLKAKRPVASRKIKQTLPMTDCFIAPCKTGCPIEQDVPEYVRLVGEGKYAEAYAVITAKNPLPFITGTICNHKCMTKCTRLDYDESVCIRDVKLAAAQKGYQALPQSTQHQPDASGNAKVAVIGAGPSGLAAGYFLAQGGMDVTIFERRERAGGTVEHVIPHFRIDAKAIGNDLELIARSGVKFVFGAKPDFALQNLQAQGFKYIYVAIGAGKTSALPITGDTQHVLGAIAFLEQFKTDPAQLNLGKHVAVVGGGNSAMDAARAALRVPGVEKVSIVYRRTREYMPADLEELMLATAEGIVLCELLSPVNLDNGMLKCQTMELGEADAQGRRSPVAKKDTYEFIRADKVLTAIGEQVDAAILVQNGISIDDKGKIIANPETLETNLANVFIGGDALYGPSTVVESIAHATRAAKAILAKEQQSPGGIEHVAPEEDVHKPGERQLAEIAAKKGVLHSGCQGEQESERCLECNYICNICTEVCPNRANVGIKVTQPGFRDYNQILHLDGMCNECGNCAQFCPYSGAPYLEKFTLFWSEADFANSTNQGFVRLSGGANVSFKIRLAGETLQVEFDATGKPKQPLDSRIAAIIWTAHQEYTYLF
ncbi:MAG: putative selenate reductase subunit YgfK [Peptococcaceae bacterium]|nr:putative selenate reductase subunit YgfK [Peptococcaceae bacterium]